MTESTHLPPPQLTPAQAKVLIARAQARLPRGGWMLAAVQDAYAAGRFMSGLTSRVGESSAEASGPCSTCSTCSTPCDDGDAEDTPPSFLSSTPPAWKDVLMCLYSTPFGAYWLGTAVASLGWAAFFLLFR